MSRIDHLHLPTWPDVPAEPRNDLRHRVLSRLLGLPTEAEEAAEFAAENAAAIDVVERIPPDDPERLAWEAELRAAGFVPAKVWGFPKRKPIRKPGWRDWVRYQLGG